MPEEPAQRTMTIGAFALASGLTIEALRHYHEIGVLVPTEVDSITGYRRYSFDQVRQGHAIRILRKIHMPLGEISQLLGHEGPDVIRKVLQQHKDRLLDRAQELQVTLATVDRLIKKGGVMPATTGPKVIGMTIMGPDLEALRSFYEDVFAIDFEGEEHGAGLHYHATGGSFSYPDGLFLFTLWGHSEGWPPLRSGIEMYVAGVDETYERALAAGAQSVHAPFDSEAFPRSAIFDDPAGNRIQIYEAE